MKYSCRPRLLQAAVEYELTDDGLTCRAVSRATKVAFSDIREIDVFKQRRFGSSRAYWACTIFTIRQRFDLGAAHRVSLTRTEDRTAAYIPFIKEFERRAIAANPGLRFVVDEYRENFGTRLYGRAAAYALVLLGCL